MQIAHVMLLFRGTAFNERTARSKAIRVKIRSGIRSVTARNLSEDPAPFAAIRRRDPSKCIGTKSSIHRESIAWEGPDHLRFAGNGPVSLYIDTSDDITHNYPRDRRCEIDFKIDVSLNDSGSTVILISTFRTFCALLSSYLCTRNCPNDFEWVQCYVCNNKENSNSMIIKHFINRSI